MPKWICAAALMVWIAPAFAQYSGPAVLSRGESPTGSSGPQIEFRPFFQFTGVYDTGLSGVGVNSQGALGNLSSYGLQFTAGVSGTHAWKHTSLGLNYRGSYSHYVQTTFYDSTSQTFMMGLTHRFSAHAAITISENAGLYSRADNVSGLSTTVPFDPQTTNVPTTDFYDNRTLYHSTQANFQIQKSRRLSFAMGGSLAGTRRRSTALYGVNVQGAMVDAQYRLSMASTVGVAYNFTRYSYNGVASDANMHSVSGSYSRRLTRRLEFSALAGIGRSETKFFQSVPLDPAIAYLIGRTTATVIGYRISSYPNVSGRLSSRFRTGVAYLSAGHSMTPGNGLFLSSSATTASAGYSYTGFRRWSLDAGVSWSHSGSSSNVQGSYDTNSANASVSRQLARYVHAVFSAYARQYKSPDFTLYNRVVYSVSFGLGFTPRDVAFRLW